MKRSNILAPVMSMVVLLIGWEYVPVLFSIPTYVFPRLSEVLSALLSGWNILQVHVRVTLAEATLGFILGSVVGFLFGVAMAQSSIFSRLTLPYVIASNAIPVVAIAPIIILWFGHALFAKIVVAAFLCFFPLVINTYRGLNQFSALYQELFLLYGSTSSEFLIRFKIPNAIPYLAAGLKLNATFSVVGAVVGEFIGANAGLGFGMLQASYNLNAPRLWGYILVACVLGVAMYGITLLAELWMIKLSKRPFARI